MDIARFRNTDTSVKGNVVEIYATVPGQWLTYLRRTPKMYQAAAVLTLEIVRPDGQAAYQETITLKPPVLSDTAAAIKNPLSFQKRLVLPDGTYTIRGLVRDQYRTAQQALLEIPLVLASTDTKPALSDLVLLTKPAAKGAVAGNFSRGGFSLTRAPGGLYARGADKLWLYAELYNATPEQELQLRYRLRRVGSKTDALALPGTTRGLPGRPTPITSELDLSKLPAGDYTLTMEVRTPKQLLATQTAAVHRMPNDYAPGGATPTR
ncbi:hypothetical protein [uncultured Hymenobacter sp.]|uniref:hypothetical protein n=1 Tax=uncultured Hymenobacter sp. TaxID=170016 RepID=UPI0035CBE40A